MQMLPHKLGVVFIYVSDMDRSVAFYRDTLGLPLRFQSEHWSEFATETVTLALRGGTSPRIGVADPKQSAAGTVVVSFYVEDVHATAAQLKERGVDFLMEPQALPAEGLTLAMFADPDGCGISLAGPLRQVSG